MSSYLVTGGAGFIGSHLAEELIRKGNAVCVIDDLSTGNLENVQHLKASPGSKRFSFVHGSVLNRSLMERLVERSDVIYHLAAAGAERGKYVMEHPLKTIQSNIHGTEMVLGFACASKRKQKVMLVSTSEVYGKDGNIPYKENGDLLTGANTTLRWIYAYTKAMAEYMALLCFKERKVPVVIIRPFDVCGPGQTGRYALGKARELALARGEGAGACAWRGSEGASPRSRRPDNRPSPNSSQSATREPSISEFLAVGDPTMVIPRFVRNALLGKPLLVYGDGTQTRCFTYVGDVVRAAITLIETEEAVGEVFNVGSIQEIQIRELAQKVLELGKAWGSSSKIEYISYKEVYGEGFEDTKRRVPDISKIHSLTGWQPKVDLDELLQKVIAYEKAVIMGTSDKRIGFACVV